jgi:hypothetical protein
LWDPVCDRNVVVSASAMLSYITEPTGFCYHIKASILNFLDLFPSILSASLHYSTWSRRLIRFTNLLLYILCGATEICFNDEERRISLLFHRPESEKHKFDSSRLCCATMSFFSRKPMSTEREAKLSSGIFRLTAVTSTSALVRQNSMPEIVDNDALTIHRTTSGGLFYRNKQRVSQARALDLSTAFELSDIQPEGLNKQAIFIATSCGISFSCPTPKQALARYQQGKEEHRKQRHIDPLLSERERLTNVVELDRELDINIEQAKDVGSNKFSRASRPPFTRILDSPKQKYNNRNECEYLLELQLDKIEIVYVENKVRIEDNHNCLDKNGIANSHYRHELPSVC